MKKVNIKNLKINKDNKTLWITLGVILVVILIIVLITTHMSRLEKDILKEDSTTIMSYMDTIENTKSDAEDGLDQYILYALEYSYNENDKSSLNCEEIKNLIESKFDVELSKDKLNAVGITPLLLDNSVMHNPEEQVYSMDRENITQRQIADIPIIFYNEKSTKKIGGKYIVKYEKVTIKNPYEILNYYSDLNNEAINNEAKDKKKNKKQEEIKTYDTTKIMNYLTAKGKIKDVKAAVNDEIIKKEGKVSKKKVKVTYVLDGTHFKVKKVN